MGADRVKLKIKIILLSALIIFFAVATTQYLSANNVSEITQTEPTIYEEWNKTFGGPDYDTGYMVRQTNDGGYIIVGWTYSYVGNSNLYIIKTDGNGNPQWMKSLGGDGYERGYCVQQTSDGGYIVVGYTTSYGAGGSDAWLIKLDANGTVLWDRTFGGASSDNGYYVQQSDDGGYIIVGATVSYGAGGADVWLIKTDSNGTEMWNKTFGTSIYYEQGYVVYPSNDGGYMVFGRQQADNDEILVIKTDAQGNELWNKTFGGNDGEWLRTAYKTSDGGFILVGRTYSYGVNGDAYVIKLDAQGNMEWGKNYGGLDYDCGNGITETSDGGYIIAGATKSYGAGYYDSWLIKIDTWGNMEWNLTFGGVENDTFAFIQQTSDGGYICVGSTQSYGAGNYDVWLVKFGSNEVVELPPISIIIALGCTLTSVLMSTKPRNPITER